MCYEYTTPEFDGEETYPDTALEFESEWSEEFPSWLAEDAALSCFLNNDGWEFDWPVVFEIYSDGKSLGKFSISMEMEPSFIARKL
jgi:hypothetical protein